MNIGFAIQSLARGGAEGQLVTLARGLAARGHRVVIFTFNDGGALEDQVRQGGVEVVGLGKSGRWDLVGPWLRLVRLVRQRRLDVVHGYLPVANVLVMAGKPFFGDARVVIGIRASDIDLAAYDRATAWSYRVERMLAPFADLAIANSESAAELYATRMGRRSKVVVVPNGIDTETFRPDKEAGRAVRGRLGIDEHSRVVGIVGRLDPMKDQETFLKAAKAALCRCPDLVFVCVGGGGESYARWLRKVSRNLGLDGKVIWVGRSDDVAAYYNAFDLLALSSAFGEGFPNVVAEAMACETPCVVTDVGDSAFVVGNAGCVVPPRDPVAMANAWLAALEAGGAVKAATKRKVRERIVAEFNVAGLVRRTEYVLAAAVEVRI